MRSTFEFNKSISWREKAKIKRVMKSTPRVSKIQEDFSRKKEIFYELATDSEFRLSDGGIIKANKGMLCCKAKSDVLFQILFGPLKDEVTVITDIDSVTFKLFLDCVMNFEPYTHDVALKILPVAWKYQVQKCIDKCIYAVDFNEVNDEICHALNMATLYGCEQLIEEILDFIFDNCGPLRFIDNESYCFLLEPNSILAFLEQLYYFSTFILDILVQWGKHYLKDDNLLNVRKLFDKSGIRNFIKEYNFETVSALNEFIVSDIGKDVFSANEIVTLTESFKDLNIVRSEWMAVRKGDIITEEVLAPIPKRKNQKKFSCCLETNSLALYDLPVHPKKVDIEISYHDGTEVFKVEEGSCFQKMNDQSCIVNYVKLMFKYLVNKVSNHGLFKIKYKFTSDCKILLTSTSSDAKATFTRRILNE